ncbi:LLM class flavin-dependent oxidoreductase [Ancylobacter mangrovi]|uniref:LLM class flavin-dependent oxidoreductase n=1 Tax=Ancylobacter mangrovi TaxID=2972472 RepID=UPI002161651F|nr:LLM class flavin-dependent oxidoreductase [Ancylobacter mangrovi]MCS0502838.1 LLM class flavin-dependent oxidoreductase [Ancylobacter mangrovi]
MLLSFFMMPLHSVQRDYATSLREDIQAFKLADELGFEEGWIGEHYSASIEQISSPLMFLAHMAPQTKRIKLGTGVMTLPLYHPVMAAAHIALLDHLAPGRLILGIGTGGLGSDFEVYGMENADRTAMMLDSIDMIKRIWAADPPYDIPGKFWDVKLSKMYWPDLGVGILPKTLTKPHPALAVSVSSPNSNSIRVAARNDFMPISANFVASWVVKTHWETYCDELAKLGKVPDGSKWRVARSIHVADTDEAAERYVKKPGGAYDWYYDYMYKVYERMGAGALLAPFRDTDPATITHELVRDNFVIYGSPETVTRKILELRDEVGPFGTLMMTSHEWEDESVMRRSMELLARRVMPAVNEALGEAPAMAV